MNNAKNLYQVNDLHIPQYHISTRLKGHNCTHPKKRLGTSTARGGEVYKKYEKQCKELIHKLISNT